MRLALALTFLLLAATPATAAYTGPQDTPTIFDTVQQVHEYPFDDQQVSLTGHILKRIAHDKYLFRDKTGVVRLEIDDTAFPPQDIDDKTQVRIHGEIDAAVLANPMVDVVRIEILPAPAGNP